MVFNPFGLAVEVVDIDLLPAIEPPSSFQPCSSSWAASGSTQADRGLERRGLLEGRVRDRHELAQALAPGERRPFRARRASSSG